MVLFRRTTAGCVLALIGGLLAVGIHVGAPASAAPAPERAGRFTASLSINRTTVLVKKAVVLRGAVTPASRGLKVVLQKRLPGRSDWVDESKLTTKADGRFSYTDKPTTPGVRSYRVIVPKADGRRQGVSDRVGLTVYRWLDLTDVPVRSGNATSSRPSTDINGVTYTPAIVGATYANSGSIDWNFSRSCTSLRARFGNGDESDSTAQAAVQLVEDGRSVYTHTFGLTQSEARTFDVSGVFRVGFTWTSSNSAATPPNTSGAQAVMAAPQVLCAF